MASRVTEIRSVAATPAIASPRRMRKEPLTRVQIFIAVSGIFSLLFFIVHVLETYIISVSKEGDETAVGAVTAQRIQNETVFLSNGYTRPFAVITASNWMYREFLLNFNCNLRRLRLAYAPVVYSLDKKTHRFSHTIGLSSVLLSEEEGDDTVPGDFEKNGPRSFNNITKRKLEALEQVLESGYDVLLSDADIYWCEDAMVYVTNLIMHNEHYRDADVLIQPEAGYRTLNSGFYMVKSSRSALALVRKLIAHNNIGAHDQDVVNKVFCDPEYGGKKIEDPYGEVPFYCKSNGAVIRVLPSQKFPSGAEQYLGVNVFSHSRSTILDLCSKGEFVVLHNNFIRATKKKARFVQKGMWLSSFDDKGLPSCEDDPVEENEVSARTCGKFCI